MADYDKSRLESLIQDYQNRMMEEYGNTVAPTADTEPVSINEDVSIKTAPPPSADTELSDIGQLQIRVSTENQAIPIPGAVVTVSHDKNDKTYIDQVLIADQSGLTPIIELATKDRTLSLHPGTIDPYTAYNVTISADGYFPKKFINLPIYGGVTAIQSVTMIPLPEAGGDDLPISYPQNGPSL